MITKFENNPRPTDTESDRANQLASVFQSHVTMRARHTYSETSPTSYYLVTEPSLWIAHARSGNFLVAISREDSAQPHQIPSTFEVKLLRVLGDLLWEKTMPWDAHRTAIAEVSEVVNETPDLEFNGAIVDPAAIALFEAIDALRVEPPKSLVEELGQRLTVSRLP